MLPGRRLLEHPTSRVPLKKEGLRKTLSHAAVYGFGTVVANAASLIMLPVYTRFLTPKDYGLLEMLSMVVDITAILFGLRVNAGIFRIYYETDEAHTRHTVMSSTWITDVGFHAAAAVILMCFAAPTAKLFVGSSAYANYVAIFAATLITLAMTAVPIGYLRALQRPWAFVWVSIGKLLLQISLNIMFVVGLGWGPLGVILSTLITGVIVGGGLSIWMLRRTGLRFSKQVSVRLLRFGFPIALASIGAFYTTYGDRFFIQHYWGLAQVGLYALAYRFAYAMYSLVYGTFDQVWSTQSYLVFKQDNRHEMFGRVFLLAMVGMIFVGTALSILARDFITVMSDRSFVAAWVAVPPLVAAYVIRAAGDFCGFGIKLHEKTSEFFWASAISVIVISVGYAGLIPRWGIVGAAFATLAGMYAEFWWIKRVSHKLEPLQLPWGRVIATGLVAVATFGASLLIPADNLIVSVVLRAALLLALAGAIYFSPIVGPQERLACRELLRDGIRKLRSA